MWHCDCDLPCLPNTYLFLKFTEGERLVLNCSHSLSTLIIFFYKSFSNSLLEFNKFFLTDILPLLKVSRLKSCYGLKSKDSCRLFSSSSNCFDKLCIFAWYLSDHKDLNVWLVWESLLFFTNPPYFLRCFSISSELEYKSTELFWN